MLENKLQYFFHGLSVPPVTCIFVCDIPRAMLTDFVISSFMSLSFPPTHTISTPLMSGHSSFTTTGLEVYDELPA